MFKADIINLVKRRYMVVAKWLNIYLLFAFFAGFLGKEVLGMPNTLLAFIWCSGLLVFGILLYFRSLPIRFEKIGTMELDEQTLKLKVNSEEKSFPIDNETIINIYYEGFRSKSNIKYMYEAGKDKVNVLLFYNQKLDAFISIAFALNSVEHRERLTNWMDFAYKKGLRMYEENNDKQSFLLDEVVNKRKANKIKQEHNIDVKQLNKYDLRKNKNIRALGLPKN